MDKFIIRLAEKAEGYKPLMIDVSTHEKIMQMKETTGKSARELVAQMVDFCAERLEIIEQ